MIRGNLAIRSAYQDVDVARTYIDERFRHPLGALLHARQAAALRRAIIAHRPQRVLEIAPGPARLTTEIAPWLEGTGVLVDTSAQMLAEARRRLVASGHDRWSYLRGDTFQLPLTATFDLVYTFRLVRHFEAADRCRIYAEVRRVLRPGGLFIFDAVNAIVSAPLRANSRPGEHEHYDALLEQHALQAELQDAGFTVTALEKVQRRYPVLHRLQVLVAPRSRRLARLAMEAVDRFGGGEPLEWIVTCRA